MFMESNGSSSLLVAALMTTLKPESKDETAAMLWSPRSASVDADLVSTLNQKQGNYLIGFQQNKKIEIINIIKHRFNVLKNINVSKKSHQTTAVVDWTGSSTRRQHRITHSAQKTASQFVFTRNVLVASRQRRFEWTRRFVPTV